MNYRIIALTLLLLPVASHADSTENGDSTEVRIKKLEEAQRNREEEIASLSNKIQEAHESYSVYKYMAFDFWNPMDEEEKRVSFNKFIIKVSEMFDAAEDIDSIIEEAPLDKEEGMDLKVIILRVVLQYLFVERMIVQYKQLVQELVVINTELKKLKG